MKFESGNSAAEKHGAAGAVDALIHGREFTPRGLAKQADVELELEERGIDAILERSAVRLQTVSDLFYDAIQAAAQSNDVDRIDHLSQRFGWIQSKAVLAWKEVKQNRKQNKGKLDEVLDAYAAPDTARSQQEAQGGTL